MVLLLDELRILKKENAALRAEVERLQERFDAVRDAAHAEAKRVFPAAVVESHFGGELHADDLCSMLSAEVERLREERRWIPVEETPPQSHTDVLVFEDGYAFGYYDAEEEGWRRIDHKFIDPAYWQPLPDPPDRDWHERKIPADEGEVGAGVPAPPTKENK